MASSRTLSSNLLSFTSRSASRQYRLLSSRGTQLATRQNQLLPLQRCSCFMRAYATRPPRKDTRPRSDETTQTDFGAMDIYANTPAPTSGIDACTEDGFALNSGMRVSGSGVLIIGGEAFKWRPWILNAQKGEATSVGSSRSAPLTKGKSGASKMRRVENVFGSGRLVNQKGQWEVDKVAWGLLELVWPKPDLLIIGTGASIVPLSPTTRQHLSDLGIRLEIQDTRNASAQFNLLATERGVQQIAAALVPIGWKDSR